MLPLRMRLPLRNSRTSLASRRYVSPTTPTSSPMARLAESEDSSPTGAPITRLNNPYSRPRQVITLPAMVPADVQTQASVDQQGLYPSAGVIDSRSMIGICLRRREHIPRAFQIFRQLLTDAQNGVRPLPEADVFANVIEGVASLGKEGMPNWENWGIRARHLVEQWETAKSPARGRAALGENGVKVYRGWLSGMLSAGISPEPLVQYLKNGQLKASDLLSGMRGNEVDEATEALLRVAKLYRLNHVAHDIESFQGRVKEERNVTSREVIPEMAPVLETRRIKGATDAPGPRFNITSLRSALEPINTNAPAHIRQEQLELSSIESAKAELEHAAELMNKRSDSQAGALARQQLQAWMHQWYRDLHVRLESEIEAMKKRVEKDPSANDPEKVPEYTSGQPGRAKTKEEVLLMYLTVLPAEKLALVTVLEAMRSVGVAGIPDGMKAIRGMLAVGKAVETEYQADTIRTVSGTDSSAWTRVLDADTQKPVPRNVQRVWASLGHRLNEAGEEVGRTSKDEWEDVWTPSWSQQAHIDLGGFLIHLLLETAKVTRTAKHPKTGEIVSEVQPALGHSYEYVKGRKLGVIRVNPVVASRLSSDYLVGMVHPKYLPMLVEPKPWTSYNQGGYLLHRVNIMRHKDSAEQVSYLKTAIAEKHTEPILHALDVLSSTPWVINRKVFDVMHKCWNDGVPIADIPASELNSNYDLPPKPDNVDVDQKARHDWQLAVKRVIIQQRKDHSERCKINYTLETARSFLNDTFYLPHSMDFRGRAYPVPPHLSPVGDDLNRGLLLFATKQPLGERGLRWLRIHLANVYGFDKLSFEERARFSEQHEKEIFESADDPINGSRWWLKAEDPWQCLATCFELSNALRSPDPTLYESSLPVHSDGTCNGMQHYAALGGDVRGARAVNLENGDRPADIYSRVVEIVNKVIEQDQKKGLQVAEMIKEPLGRKIVKQTVMTTVYGVTFVGARDQIAKQLISRTDIEAKHIFAVSAYLAKTVLSCIGDLFANARDIQDWLVTCARLISRSIPEDRLQHAAEEVLPLTGKNKVTKARLPKELMSAVIWTTPLGLPVVQPYRKQAKKQVMTSLQTVYVCDPNQPSEVSPLKQASAFPPNFIHSLDATHMFITALRCNQNGITFASVHDSYWTHAASVESMSELIRDSFIQLHTQDLVGELRAEFMDRYGNNYIPIENARIISRSAHSRREGELKRRQEVRVAMGESDQDIEVDSHTSNLVEAETEVFGEAEEPKEKDVLEDSALSESEIENLLTNDSPNIHKVGKYRFIKLGDLLPPCPPRGAFDVEKIRESAYFFS